MKMAQVSACRVCLATNVRMYRLTNTPLQHVYEKLTSTLLETADRRPIMACYVCFHLLKKSYKLMQISSKAEKLLSMILKSGLKLNPSSLSMIDRHSHGLSWPMQAQRIRRPAINITEELDPLVHVKNEPVDIEIEHENDEQNTKLNLTAYSDSEDDDPPIHETCNELAQRIIREVNAETTNTNSNFNETKIVDVASKQDINYAKLVKNQKTIIENQQIIIKNQGIMHETQKCIIERSDRNETQIENLAHIIDDCFSIITKNNPTVDISSDNQPLDTTNTENSDIGYFKTISSEKDLEELENRLSDESYKVELKNQFVPLYSLEENATRCAYKLLDMMFDRKFLCCCSWSGGSKDKEQETKIALKFFKNTLSFFYEIICCVDSRYTIEECETFFKGVLKNAKQRSMAHSADSRPTFEDLKMRLKANESRNTFGSHRPLACIKPVDNEKELNDLESLLSNDKERYKLKQKYLLLCSKADGSGITCAYKLVDLLFTRKFLCKCSWAGGSRTSESKIAFKCYKNIMKFSFELINYWDSVYTYNEHERFFKGLIKNSAKRMLMKNMRTSTRRMRRKRAEILKRRLEQSQANQDNNTSDIMEIEEINLKEILEANESQLTEIESVYDNTQMEDSLC